MKDGKFEVGDKVKLKEEHFKIFGNSRECFKLPYMTITKIINSNGNFYTKEDPMDDNTSFIPRFYELYKEPIEIFDYIDKLIKLKEDEVQSR